MNISLSTNIVTISKLFDQTENEDFPFHHSIDEEDYSLWVVCDGAGGSGVFCKEWAKHIAENIPVNPIEFESNYKNWFREISERFYDDVLSKADLSDLILNKKVHRDGSNSTMSALWVNKRKNEIYFSNVGDSCIFYFEKNENKIIPKFITPYNAFNEIEPPSPTLLNWNEPITDNIDFGCEEIKNNFIILIASDSLSRWIIQALSIIDYASVSNVFKTNFLQSLNTGKYEERKVAIHLNSTYSSTDELLKYLQKSSESIDFFKTNLKGLIESEQIDLDDYSLIFIEGNVSK